MPNKVSVHRHSSPTYHTKSIHDHTSPRHNHANVPHNIHAPIRHHATNTHNPHNKRNTRAKRRQQPTSACTIVKNNTIIPSTQNIEKIHATKQPHNRKTLRSFLKAVNAYKEFIPDHARLRTPLVNLLKKDVMWVWSDECQKAFTNLKESLTTHPTLYLYQEGLPCQVYCNTSTFGIAGILKQVYPDGKTYPVQHFSRSLRGHERNYSDLELQCLAIVESVDNFRACLMGRKFTILSDHPALQWLKEIKAPSGRLFRWRLRLSRYEYEVRSINGVQQYETGVVTRIPFCGFLDAPLIKSQQSSPPGKSRVTMDHNELRTVSRKGVLKTIVPSSLTARLLKSVHTQHHHPNISKMTRLISSQYYWQNMTQDIAKQSPKFELDLFDTNNNNIIVAYRDLGSYYRRITARFIRYPMTVSRIWNRWVQDDHTERHTGSQRPAISNSREDLHVACMALVDRIARSRALSQEMESCASKVSKRLIRRRFQQHRM
ncbi:K02A2.6-like [Cordylochernes scorpioides]|uniref:RNA-directed DNA polymerase n=1 Tax=Cordylochernes scorpioides TaxID=51811 RepID=A0ABY6KR61_9ARAC|nr:K02A2.6-like [Cordylochernes scorpioides]